VRKESGVNQEKEEEKPHNSLDELTGLWYILAMNAEVEAGA